MKFYRHQLVSLIILGVLMIVGSLDAQENKKDKKDKEKIIIIKKHIDKDGNEKVEKIIKDGSEEDGLIWINEDGKTIELEGGKFEFLDEGDLESLDILKLKDGEPIPEDVKKRLEELDIHIEHPSDSKKIIRIEKKGDGAEHKVIEWEGEGELPEDILKELKLDGIHKMHIERGDHDLSIHIEGMEGKAFLGVEIGKKVEVINENGQETTTESYGDGNGVFVDGVIEGSAAAEAGLQQGDILKAIDGQTITVFDDLTDFLDGKSPGDAVTISYERNGALAETNAVLGAHPGTMDYEGEHEFEIEVETDGMESETNVFIIKEKKGVTRNIKKKRIIIIDDGEMTEEELIEETPEVALQRSLDIEAFEVFPNPTDGQVTIQFAAAAENTTISITDISGREIFRENLPNFDGNYNNTIDLRKAAKGALLLSINQRDKVFTERIILK